MVQEGTWRSSFFCSPSGEHSRAATLNHGGAGKGGVRPGEGVGPKLHYWGRREQRSGEAAPVGHRKDTEGYSSQDRGDCGSLSSHQIVTGRGRPGGLSWLSVRLLVSAQVVILWFMGSISALGSVLTAQSLEPASDSVSPSFSAPPLFTLSLSLKNK